MSLYTDIVRGNSFHNVWVKAMQKVIANGTDLVIGGSEEKKPIRDSCILISLEGNAIKQIEAREIHPQYIFKNVDEYCKEFTREFLEEYVHREEAKKFAYLYWERLAEYVTRPGDVREMCRPFDQIKNLRTALAYQIFNNVTSNRFQAMTWIPEYDSYAKSPPCLQRIQIRYIPENKVDVHLTWRSRDLYGAWQANVIAIIDMLNREVIKPNGCEILRIIDFSDSLHIYKTDLEAAKKVKLVVVSPQEVR